MSTAAPAAAAIRLLARGRLESRGAFPPERCVDPDDLFPELEGRGCEFKIEVDGEPSENDSALSLGGKLGSSEDPRAPSS